MIHEKTEAVKEKVVSRSWYFPARFVLTILLFWAMSLEFAHKVCLGMTIVAMVNHTALDAHNDSSTEDLNCPDHLTHNETDQRPQGEYVWTPTKQGIVLGAYFYGFVCTQILGGRLAELVGGKWPLGLAILGGSILTMITPMAADIGVGAIVVVRITMGLIHGICLPTVFAMFAHWAPVSERSTLIAICIIGDHVGTVLSMPLAGFLCDNGFAGGWPSVFYVLGVLGCVWFLFWACLAYNKPSDHPRISVKELEYINKDNIQMAEEQKVPVPWKDVLSSLPVWSVALVSFCYAWGHNTLLTKLPTYLEVVLHVPIKKNGLVNSLLYVCTCATIFTSAYISDYLRSKKGFSPTKVRKGFQLVAMFGPAVCSALIPLMGCRKTLVISLLSLSMAFVGLHGGGHASIAADMAPHHAGTIFGLVNGFGCTAGILAPLVAGIILDNAHASIQQWSSVFYLCAGIYTFGGIVFSTWASAEKQAWAYTPIKEQYSINTEKDPVIREPPKDFQEKKSKNWFHILKIQKKK